MHFRKRDKPIKEARDIGDPKLTGADIAVADI